MNRIGHRILQHSLQRAHPRLTETRRNPEPAEPPYTDLHACRHEKKSQRSTRVNSPWRRTSTSWEEDDGCSPPEGSRNPLCSPFVSKTEGCNSFCPPASRVHTPASNDPVFPCRSDRRYTGGHLSLIHISEPTRRTPISY